MYDIIKNEIFLYRLLIRNKVKEMKQNSRKTFAILSLLLVIFYFCFIIIHYDHDCTHTDDCIICSIIRQSNHNIEGLGFGLGIVFVVCFLMYFIENQVKLNKELRKN